MFKGSYRFPKKSVGNANLNLAVPIQVSTVAELEKALENQKTNQVIEVFPGEYILTKAISIPVSANGGVLKGLGMVAIEGADGEDAITINPAAASASFEYTIENIDSLQGGEDCDGLVVKNENVVRKIIVYLNDVSLYSNGSGDGLKVVNTETDAIRIYATGNHCRWPGTVSITPKVEGDRFYFFGIDLEGGLAGAVVDIDCNYKFYHCLLKHAGITGGHATNIVNVYGCFTIETTDIALADAADFPGAFSPTILPES